MNDGREIRSRPHHLPGHFYMQPGVFFLTICTKNRNSTLAEIVAGKPHLSPLGELVSERWQALPEHHPGVTLDCFVVMPNHIHGLISTLPAKSSVNAEERPPVDSVPRIVNAFKSSVTRYARLRGLAGEQSVWQSDYWDHVVRHQRALDKIREYILNNPLAWELDRENPRCSGVNGFYEWLEWYQRSLIQLSRRNEPAD